MKLYKWTGKDGAPCHGGSGAWVLGEWRKAEGPLVACQNGLHLCREKDVAHWIGAELYKAEAKSIRIREDDKVVCRTARVTKRLAWDDCTARLFAADCAEGALKIVGVTDVRSWDAVWVARGVAFGVVGAAARAAAETAAWAAARAAASAAASAASETAARAAASAAAWAAASAASETAAWAAASAASETAAWAAARAAAWAAARAAQSSRILDYADGRADLDAIREDTMRELSERGIEMEAP